MATLIKFLRSRIIYLAAAFFPLTLPAVTANGATTIFTIDAVQRGIDISAMIKTFIANNVNNNVAEVLIQTTTTTYPGLPGNLIVKGLIPFVKSITPATNSTLFIVSFSSTKNGSPYTIVVPIEQIVEVILTTNFNNLAPGGQAYSSTFANGVIPLLSIHPTLRAADIIFAVNTLATFATGNQIRWRTAIQTTVNGSSAQLFYPSTVANGLFKYVTSVAQLNNAFVQINYTSGASSSGSFIVSSEQVQQIYLYPP